MLPETECTHGIQSETGNHAQICFSHNGRLFSPFSHTVEIVQRKGLFPPDWKNPIIHLFQDTLVLEYGSYPLNGLKVNKGLTREALAFSNAMVERSVASQLSTTAVSSAATNMSSTCGTYTVQENGILP